MKQQIRATGEKTYPTRHRASLRGKESDQLPMVAPMCTRLCTLAACSQFPVSFQA